MALGSEGTGISRRAREKAAVEVVDVVDAAGLEAAGGTLVAAVPDLGFASGRASIYR
jgi:hypothetical protein